ncbi:MAG: diguanylate cyclase [Solirubrobacteraceae bacterium]
MGTTHPGAPPALPRSALLVGLPNVGAVLAMVVSRLAPALSPYCWDTAWTLASFSAFAGMMLARRVAPAADRGRWSLWAAAAGSWFVGQMLWNLYGIIGFPQSPNLADVGWWAFAVLVMVSLMRSRVRTRAMRIVSMAETLPLVAAAVALSVAELWHAASVSALALAPRLSALIYPSVYIAATVLMLQAMVGGALRGSRSPALRLVLAGMAAQALAFGLWSQQLLAGTYVPGNTVLDPIWVLGLGTIGIGGLVAFRSPATTDEGSDGARRGGVLPAVMFVVLIGALLQAQVGHAAFGARIVLGLGVMLSGVSLITRGGLLERRLRERLAGERAALRALGEREAELARLNTQLVEDSRRDPLTGMRNRRALSEDLLQLDAARLQDGRPFAVALCDVDHFKAYNDRLGHLAGDHALRGISATIRGALRSGDVAYRFGGEELLIIFPDTDETDALVAAERVRVAVETAAMSHPEGVAEILTVSIGVAAGCEEPSTLLARADVALYRAKHAGRNRAELAIDTDPAESNAGRHHELPEEAVPRHLRSMLAVSRAAAAGEGPMPVLEALADTLRSELSFHVVSVNLRDRQRDQLHCVIVLGDEDARRTLLGNVSPWSEFEPLLESEHRRCGAIWLPAGTPLWERETVTWTPAVAAAPGADSWHPDDMLLLPIRAQGGEVLAIVSVDQPVSGRRPDDGEIAFLMSAADHAGIGLEQSLRDSAPDSAAQQQSDELRLAAVMLLAETLDLRDPGTARHSRTVGVYARRIATELALDADRIERIHAAGVLHDLGKLGIADAVLYKPGSLDDAEWREIQRHPEIGARILENAGLRDIAGWVRGHHERMDGRGYPDRLNSHQISLESRILAVADAYEAMIADRPYRAGMPSHAAREELERCAGSQFDPAVVTAFIATLPQDEGGRPDPVCEPALT